MRNIYKAGKETGAKIKQFVITRPKFHKVLKAIKIIVNVLVYGFTILMIIGLCVGTTLTNKNNNDGVVKQNAPSYHAVIKDNYQLYNVNGDLISLEFLNALLSHEDARSGLSFTSIYEMVQYYNNYGMTTEQNCFAGFGADPSSTTGVFGYAISWDFYGNDDYFTNYSNQDRYIRYYHIKLDAKTYENYTNNNYIYREYQFHFKAFSPNNTNLFSFEFVVGAFFTQSNTLNRVFILNIENAMRFVLVNDSITSVMDSNIMYTLYQDNNPTYKGGYEAGFNNGYNAGFNADSGSNDAFTLIRGAFYAIADILNINVLPHLTLGVLIFAPLIVTLIIVIVKMVRG